MKIETNNKVTDATFRKFMAAASDLAFEFSENGQDGYKITREAFVEMLRDALPKRRFIEPHSHGTPRMN
jgi:hypothetical protein